jgi:hypothetical protein
VMKRSKNALFSFHRGMLGDQPRRITRLKRIAWDRLSREKRRKVAIAAGVSEKIAGVWAQIRWRDIPEGWKSALLSNLEAARNPMKKSKRKKKKATRKVARRPRTTRKKKNSRARRRNRTVTFPIPVTPAQKKKVQRFLTSLTGRRVKMK